jgi:hypothetical protein
MESPRISSAAWQPGVVNLALTICWRGLRRFAQLQRSTTSVRGCVSPESLQSFFALVVGFAVAGLLTSGYQLVMKKPVTFGLLQHGPRFAALSAVPVLMFAAPLIIIRNSLRAHRSEGRRFVTVMVATVAAGYWSLMSGTVVLMAIERIVLS